MPSNVALDQPGPGSEVTTNPFVVAGRARTFENHVGLRLEDGTGRVIREGYATARGEIGLFNPFSQEMFITVDPGDTMKVVALEYSAQDGSIRSRDESLVRVTAPRKTVSLHFPNLRSDTDDCSQVEPVVRNLPASLSAARLAVEALIAGPTQAEQVVGVSNPFPKGSEVRSVNLRNGVLTVDFNERLQNVGGSCRAIAIRAAVERTLRELEGVDRVVITAMGSEATALQP
ncbi:MAG TPA: Gmad2 immunoglobulin-like domain-containing protein [Thermoanaerobaculia bacterium]|nr:Gmad2 immunoglobulin-like domain-containing protein [Thermoanaerobaculia bacterium]